MQLWWDAGARYTGLPWPKKLAVTKKTIFGPTSSSMQSFSRRDIQSAVRKKQIIPYFQPLVQIRTGVLSGFEVLARWHHPEQGLISADKFITEAEQTGLIPDVTELILEHALAAAVKLPDHLQISVNISPVQLRNNSLPLLIRKTAEAFRFPLDRLIVEITETALVENLEQARAVTTALKDMGVKLALDDFGTGYSSLSHLQTLPFEELKLDRSFVRSMLSSRESRKIVAAVIGLGQSLRLTTVAEGVENEQQAEILRWLGCELGQGWLYGRAVAAAELPDTIARLASSAVPSGSPFPELEKYIDPVPAQRLAQNQAIYEGAPVGLSLLNSKLEYVNVNQRLADMNGLPISAHIGRRVCEVLPPHLFAQLEPWLARAVGGERLSSIEVKKTTGPGPDDFAMLLISYEPVRDEAGEILGVSVAVVDITERKRMENALRESLDHHRHMMELNPHIPWVMEPNGCNLEISAAWEELTGQTPVEAANFGAMAVFHPADQARLTPVFETALAAGHPIDVEFRVRTKSGEWRWMRSRGKPCRDATGQILRWYGSVEDIHEQKNLQETLYEAIKLLTDRELSVGPRQKLGYDRSAELARA
jgi:PAS domain S-box-containing protein